MAETIGAVNVEIGGDLGKLQDALQQADALAASSGTTIAAALSDAYQAGAGSLKEALDSIITSLGGAGQAAESAATQLSTFGGSLNIDILGSAAQETENLGAALAPLPGAAGSAGTAMQELGAHAKEAEEGTGALLKELLAFAGIGVSLEALKEFAKESIELFAETERARNSIAFMSGDAQKAAESIEALKVTAQELAQPFDSLVDAERKLTAYGASFDNIKDAIQAASDTAAATGESFDAVAGKLESIGVSGMVSARNLRTLGLDMGDLADLMGVRTDQVKTAFQNMDIDQRIEVISQALETRFPDAARKMADDTTGQLQRAKNQFAFTMEEIGAALAPAVSTLLPALSEVLKAVVSIADTVVFDLKEVINVVVGMVSTTVAGAEGLATAFEKLLSGDVKGAIESFKDTIANMGSTASATWAAMKQDAADNSAFISKVYGDQAKASEDSSDRKQQASAKTIAQLALEKAAYEAQQKEIEKLTESETSLLDKIPDDYDQYLSRLNDGGQKAQGMISQLSSAIDKVSEAASKSGAAADQLQPLIDKLEAAREKAKQWADEDALHKIAGQVGDLAAKFPELDTAALNTFNDVLGQLETIPGAVAANGSELIKWLQEIEAEHQKVQDAVDKTQQKMDRAWEQYIASTQQAIPITATLKDRLVDIHDEMVIVGEDDATTSTTIVTGMNEAGAAILAHANAVHALGLGFDQAKQSIMSAFEVEREGIGTGLTTLPEYEAAWARISAQVSKLATSDLPAAIKMQQEYLDDLQNLDAPEGKILAAEDALLQLRIKQAQQNGKSTAAYLIALEQIRQKESDLKNQNTLWDDIRVKMEALHTSTQQLANSISTDLVKAFNDSFGAISKDLDDAIVNGNNFADSLIKSFKSIATSILQDLIQAALTPLKNALIEMISGGSSGGGLFGSLGGAISGALGGLTGLGSAASATSGVITGAGGAIEAAATSAAGLGSAATTAATSVSSVGSSATSMGSSLIGTLGPIGAVGSAISAVTGIIGLFQGAAQLATEKLIEWNTRVTAIFAQAEYVATGQINASTDDLKNFALKTMQDSEVMVADLDAIGQYESNILGTLQGIAAVLGDVQQNTLDATNALNTGIKVSGTTAGSATGTSSTAAPLTSADIATISASVAAASAVSSAPAVQKAQAALDDINGQIVKQTEVVQATGDKQAAAIQPAVDALGALRQEQQDALGALVDAQQGTTGAVASLNAQLGTATTQLIYASSTGNPDLIAAAQVQVRLLQDELAGQTATQSLQAQSTAAAKNLLDAFKTGNEQLITVAQARLAAVQDAVSAESAKLGDQLASATTQLVRASSTGNPDLIAAAQVQVRLLQDELAGQTATQSLQAQSTAAAKNLLDAFKTGNETLIADAQAQVSAVTAAQQNTTDKVQAATDALAAINQRIADQTVVVQDLQSQGADAVKAEDDKLDQLIAGQKTATAAFTAAMTSATLGSTVVAPGLSGLQGAIDSIAATIKGLGAALSGVQANSPAGASAGPNTPLAQAAAKLAQDNVDLQGLQQKMIAARAANDIGLQAQLSNQYEALTDIIAADQKAYDALDATAQHTAYLASQANNGPQQIQASIQKLIDQSNAQQKELRSASDAATAASKAGNQQVAADILAAAGQYQTAIRNLSDITQEVADGTATVFEESRAQSDVLAAQAALDALIATASQSTAKSSQQAATAGVQVVEGQKNLLIQQADAQAALVNAIQAGDPQAIQLALRNLIALNNQITAQGLTTAAINQAALQSDTTIRTVGGSQTQAFQASIATASADQRTALATLGTAIGIAEGQVQQAIRDGNAQQAAQALQTLSSLEAAYGQIAAAISGIRPSITNNYYNTTNSSVVNNSTAPSGGGSTPQSGGDGSATPKSTTPPQGLTSTPIVSKPLPSFALGGIMGEDGWAWLHGGETIIPPDGVVPSGLLSRLRMPTAPSMGYSAPSVAGGGSAAGGIGTMNVSFTINESSNPRETMRQIRDYFKTISPKASAYSGN